MSLKQTSQRILLALWDTQSQPKKIEKEWLALFLPSLSEAGIRSLLHYLSKNNLVTSTKLSSEHYLGLTVKGAEHLKADFPVFKELDSPWKGEWALVIFTSPPSGDAQFRYLRKLLVELAAHFVSRGVYLVPFPLHWELADELKKRYWESVLVVKMDEVLIGDFEVKNQLSDLANLYSGISKEIESLLLKSPSFFSLNEGQKKLLISVFDRLYSLIQKDSGILRFYFPQVTAPTVLLKKWQELVFE